MFHTETYKIITGKKNINSNHFTFLHRILASITLEVTVTSWKLTEVVWSSEEIFSVRESYAIGTSYMTTWSTPVQSIHPRIVWTASGATTVHVELLARQLQVQVSTSTNLASHQKHTSKLYAACLCGSGTHESTPVLWLFVILL